MSYTIELEKLTEEQLEAFKVIDPKAYKVEKENRSTYTDEDMKNFQIYSDLDKAYYYLKPMYDNMRNTDVKKTITESGILTTLEKIFRWTKKKNVTFKRFEPTVVEKTEMIKAEISVPLTVGEPEINVTSTASEPEVKEEIPAFVVTPDMVKVVEPQPQPEPIPAPQPEPIPAPLENMSTEELNKIMASIPAVEKI